MNLGCWIMKRDPQKKKKRGDLKRKLYKSWKGRGE